MSHGRTAHDLIPAGCQTYSKGDDQFPSNAPSLIASARGARCWDTTGREFVDWGMGLRSVILGHAHPGVLRAVTEELSRGSNFTRPAPIEGELAELMIDLIPCAQMVKFGKNGSDVNSAAVRLARGFTERDLVARCRQNAFLSFNDWFIGSTAVAAGIPTAVRDLTLQFDYNDLGSLEQLFDEHPGRIGCVILEVVSAVPPAPGFLEGVKALSHKHGAVLVFDEVISGFRWHLRGAQTFFGVTPDLATFGKAMGNGFAVSALVGRKEIMERGGLNHPFPRVFLMSSTHGGETHSLAASIATIKELRETNGVERLWETGRQLMDGVNAAMKDLGIESYVHLAGTPCSPYLVTLDQDEQPSLDYRTLFLQETVEGGVLMPWIAISCAHGKAEITQTVEACHRAGKRYQQALSAKDPRPFFDGPAVKPVFRAFN